jgi:1-acyl-sn-glycerol-3-phosphate acyltransferase
MKTKPFLRAIFRTIIRFLFALLTHINVEGRENIPKQGGAILAANHQGLIDSPLIFIMLDRNDVTGLVADKYKKKPIFPWLVSVVDGIWINREEADVHAMRAARDYLKNGGLLGIAPEGTRSHTGGLIPAKTGVAYLADKSNVPIIPIAIAGTEKLFDELFHLRRPHLMIHFGEAFRLPPLERSERSEVLQRNTDEIMCRIAAMLPPDYWGVYADHPRLKELLASQPSDQVIFKT